MKREDLLADPSFDGAWTLLIGEEDEEPGVNRPLVVEGDKAWYADTPEVIGTFAFDDTGATITLPLSSAGGQPCALIITARPLGSCLSGTLNVYGDGANELSEACLLFRDGA